jgi:hypothetical protein
MLQKKSSNYSTSSLQSRVPCSGTPKQYSNSIPFLFLFVTHQFIFELGKKNGWSNILQERTTGWEVVS